MNDQRRRLQLDIVKAFWSLNIQADELDTVYNVSVQAPSSHFWQEKQ